MHKKKLRGVAESEKKLRFPLSIIYIYMKLGKYSGEVRAVVAEKS